MRSESSHWRCPAGKVCWSRVPSPSLSWSGILDKNGNHHGQRLWARAKHLCLCYSLNLHCSPEVGSIMTPDFQMRLSDVPSHPARRWQSWVDVAQPMCLSFVPLCLGLPWFLLLYKPSGLRSRPGFAIHMLGDLGGSLLSVLSSLLYSGGIKILIIEWRGWTRSGSFKS